MNVISPRSAAKPLKAPDARFPREDMPVLVLDEATAMLDLVDVAVPAGGADGDVVVDGRLSVGGKDALSAGIAALNAAMLVAEDESVAA